jgi:hypothetical protein
MRGVREGLEKIGRGKKVDGGRLLVWEVEKWGHQLQL